MTRWHLSSRTLAYRLLHNVRRQSRFDEYPRSWQALALRSYTTALNGTRQDEASQPLSYTFPSTDRMFETSSEDSTSARGDDDSGRSTAEDNNPSHVRRKRHRDGKRQSAALASQEASADGAITQHDVTERSSNPRHDATHAFRRPIFKSSSAHPRIRLTEGWHEGRVLGKRLTAEREPRQVRMRRRAQILPDTRERIASGSTMRPRWASLKSNARPSAVNSNAWNRQFALIHRALYEPIGLTTEGQTELSLDPAVHEWVQHALDQLSESGSTLSMQDIPNPSEKGLQWMFMQVALWMLQHEPDRMVDILRATHTEPYPPIDWIEDSLNHLARCLSSAEDTQRPLHKQRLLELFRVLAHRSTGERLRFVNGFVRDILPYCDAAEVCELYDTIKDLNIKVHGFTLLHVATRCAKEGRFEQASDALLRAKDAGVIINLGNYRSACSTVIRGCMSQPNGLRACLQLVSELVDAGLKLNGPICDIIMLNAVDAGDVNTAFSVYRSLTERGLKPRESTFAILLKGCKFNIDDADMLNGIIRDAISNVNVRQSRLVATEILHCLALHHTKHNPDTALRTITEAYAQLFDMTPLRELALPLPPLEQQRVATEEPMQPSPHAIGFMISASIQRIQSYSQRPDDIASIYTRWRELVETGHPLLSQLATTDHIANTFLMAFIRTSSGLVFASRVVRDMQRSLPPFAIVEQCKPTVQTWSIFLHGFTRHGKTKLAEQVLTYMRSKGIEPNDVTWNTLITGYARGQDVEGTFEALRRAERGGHLWSRWTDDGIKWLRDRGRVAREMDRRKLARQGKELDFSDDLKAGLQEKIGGDAWGDGEVEAQGPEMLPQVCEKSHRYVPNQGSVDSEDN